MEKWTLQNKKAALEVLETGAIISSFSLGNQSVNPLSFAMETAKNSGSYYRGHFKCVGRWGDPTPGEQLMGIHKHGNLFQLAVTAVAKKALQLDVAVNSVIENLQVETTIALDATAPCFTATDTITNTGVLSRLCNMVQHPTLAAPFLSPESVVNCNATTGFTYTDTIHPTPDVKHWPNAALADTHHQINLEKPSPESTGVYCYTVDPNCSYGWITAYAPAYQLLLGYIWRRETYPWINHWLHWKENNLLYRGMEFGTTGLHHNYKEIVDANALKRFNERTCFMLDANETRTFRYAGFLQHLSHFAGISEVGIHEKGIYYRQKDTNDLQIIELDKPLNL